MVGCKEYIAKSDKNFAERFIEQLKAPSPIYDHYNTTDHTATVDNLITVRMEKKTLPNQLKKPFSSVNDPSLNRNIDNYKLPHI